MTGFDDFDWRSASPEDQLAMARRGDAARLRRLARSYDWARGPEPVLGWIMAQKCIDLGTALTVFHNGEPERFNYMPKRDVPAGFTGATRVLDNICLRVNSGFYLARAASPFDRRAPLRKWLAYQAADRAEGRRGRWILDEEIVRAVLEDTAGPPPGAGGPGRAPDLLEAMRRRPSLPRLVTGLLPRRG